MAVRWPKAGLDDINITFSIPQYRMLFNGQRTSSSVNTFATSILMGGNHPLRSMAYPGLK